MSVKSFKFVSPGVFINEIDNSFIPRAADAIGPVIIGRSQRGLGMTPVKVESYSQFVEMFGDTVPGNAGGDIYRDGNRQSPMYGTYAAKAFLNANVAPLTYIRLMGTQNSKATSGYAGWETSKDVNASLKSNGGAYGLFVWPSGSTVSNYIHTGTLAAVWYMNSGSTIMLSGGMPGVTGLPEASNQGPSVGGLYVNDSTSYLFTAVVSGSDGTSEKIDFGFDDSQETFIRKRFNTNPQLASTAGEFYPASAAKSYWLGETYGQEIRDGMPVSTKAVATVTFADTGVGVDSSYTASTIAFTDYLGTTHTIAAVDASQVDTGTADGHYFNVTGANTVLATRLETCLGEVASGRFTVSVESNVVSVTQVVGGSAYNLDVTVTDTGAGVPGLTSTNFKGGRNSSPADTGTSLVGARAFGAILPLAKRADGANDVTAGMHNMLQQSTTEARTSWFIGQDLGAAASYQPELAQKLFRLKGRGHGEWLHKNVKVSIEQIRVSNSSLTDYGSFSVVLRELSDTDNRVVILERFDNCNLDPASPNYIARVIGDKYTQWDSITRRLKTYGEYDNMSKFVYVEMNAEIDGGASGLETLLPFGYYGPPKFSNVEGWASQNSTAVRNRWVIPTTASVYRGSGVNLSASSPADSGVNLTASLAFPIVRLRLSASDGGLADQTNAYFGMQTTRSPDSTHPDPSVGGVHRLLYSGFPDDPVGGSVAGVDNFAYIFSLDDVKKSNTTGVYYWLSGSRKDGTSYSASGSNTYKTLLNAGYDRFTVPLWGGFDGWNIKLPDPTYNKGLVEGTSNELNSYVYNTYKQAIDTVADPEQLDMNMLSVPGLTFNALTQHAINVCEERADALAVIDLADVYIPAQEQYKSDKKDRIGTTPQVAANNLVSRRIDSSYGCTFYPWVQTRDEQTGRLLWIPPSVAMLGVLASSHKKSEVWFAPAGFNRGGLSDGAAGIPVTGITERLTSKERDTLYEARINPIASFPSSGIVVFGQKTLQERQSALDRINVRRLVIYLKKQISILSTQVLFEQNVQATWNRFKSLIEPFLANVKVQFGITDYKLILDETTTTPDLIDQNILYAKIMVKPARAIEYIAIDFVIASTGASFDD